MGTPFDDGPLNDGPFNDGKDDGALRTIGEVSAALGIRTHVLRYWEQQFPMLDPLKRSGGRRYYRSEDIALVQDIDRLVNREGYTLKGAKAALGGDRTAAAQHPAEPSREIESKQHAVSSGSSLNGEMLGRLKSIRTTLAEALEA